MKQLNFLHLVYLQALVEEGNVTRAAERMGVSQPAMSSALAKLRLLFRDPLLIQTRQGMEPTPRAFELTRLSREISFLSEGRGISEKSFLPEESSVHWKVMASDAIARGLLPPLMDYLGKHAPLMRLNVLPGDPRKVQDYLRDSEFDLAITFVRNPASELRQIVLYTQKLVCIARTGHPGIEGKLSLKQFIGQKHVRWGTPPLSHATLEAMVDEKLARLGYLRHVSLQVSSLNLIPEVVANSNLLAVVPERVATWTSQTLALETFLLPFKVPQVDVSMIWHERLHLDPAHKWLRHRITEIVKND